MNKEEVLKALKRGDFLSHGKDTIHQYKDIIFTDGNEYPVDVKTFSEMEMPWEEFSIYRYSSEVNRSLLVKFHQEMTWNVMRDIFPKAFLHGMNEIFDVIDNAKRLGVFLFAPGMDPLLDPIGIYARLNHPAVTREMLEENEELFEESNIMLYRLRRNDFTSSLPLADGGGLGNLVLHHNDMNFQHLLNMAAYIIIVTESEIGCSQGMYAAPFNVRIRD